MVKNPVLFMTFVRPDYARLCWNAIKKSQPKVLYFYSNKGRVEKEGEIERNNEIRSFIKEIDWNCDLHTWFREEYVDLYTSLLGAKNWAFKNEKRVIMLEEDCLASPAFFEFCDFYLDLYENDKQIGFITGNNYTNGFDAQGADHFITRSTHHYGWATWKDRWDLIDFTMSPRVIIKGRFINNYFKDDKWLAFYYNSVFRKVTSFVERTQCWDYLKVMSQFKYQTYAVTPIYNLIQNVGREGTHTHSGSGNIYDLGNGEERGHYHFLGKKIEITPNSAYDYAESKAEGIRKLSTMLIIWCGILFPKTYERLKKMFKR